MTSEINYFFENLDERFEEVKSQALKYYDEKSSIRKDGAAEIFNRPWIAPLNFGILVFPPVEKEWIDIFNKRTGIEIPNEYQEILLKMNGFRIYSFNLYGLPKSLYENGLLDRLVVQQLSLESANTLWKAEFKNNENFFLIGGRRFNENENLGYFLQNEKIFSKRKNGEILNSWNSFRSFLTEEIKNEENYMLKQRK